MKARAIAMLCLSMLLGVSGVMAQDKKPEGTAPSEAAMMEAMMKAAQPGEPHKHLARLAGDWEYSIRMWMAPGQPPEESKGTMHGEMKMDGRYVQTSWKGTFSGMPFEGQGTDGYDNGAKEYFSTWIDNMGTGVMISKGSCEAGGKVCTMSGPMPDPMGGPPVTSKSVITWTDNDHFKNEMFMKDPAGNEMKMMEISASRKK